jgi:hypothetical protein
MNGDRLSMIFSHSSPMPLRHRHFTVALHQGFVSIRRSWYELFAMNGCDGKLTYRSRANRIHTRKGTYHEPLDHKDQGFNL